MKANANARSTAQSTAAHGARCTSGSMRRRWRYGPSKSPATPLGTPPCCPSDWQKSHTTRLSPVSVQTVRMTRRAAWMRWSSGGAQAVTPPRKNASLWKRASPGSANRNEAVLACKRLGWRPGERAMARTFGRQVVQLHIRVALLYRFSPWGRTRTVAAAAVAWVRLGQGSCRAEFDLNTKGLPTSRRRHRSAKIGVLESQSATLLQGEVP